MHADTPEVVGAVRGLRREDHRRWVRGGVVAAAAGFGVFALMADDGRIPCGVALGAVLVLVAAGAVLHVARARAGTTGAAGVAGPAAVAGSAGTSGEALAGVATIHALLLPAAIAGLSALLVWGSLAAAVRAFVPQPVAGAALTVGVVALAASLYACALAMGAVRAGEDGRGLSLWRREGFWLVVVAAVVDFPALGLGSLTDPWETHYGEVAREVLARDDWISLWWSWEGFFYSKPVLGIWLQSLSMAVLGVDVRPDRMLAGMGGRLAHPEWAVRAPFAAASLLGAYLLYRGMSRWVGRRAALLGGIALVTAPFWFLVAHQSMTDMPFVAGVAGAFGLVLLAAREEEDAVVRSYAVRVGRWTATVDAGDLVLGAALLVVLPQIVYLATRNLELVLHAAGPHGFRPHMDEVRAGSGLGGCRLPGNPPCATHRPSGRLEPWAQAALWGAGLAVLLAAWRRERRTKRVLYLGAWLLAALATMAKGPAGAAIPGAAVLAWIVVTKRFGELRSACVATGPVLLALVVGPWFLAALVRHGTVFTDELIFHDMWNRALSHVHDTNSGADTSFVYYLQQLAYGLFPWTALAAAGFFGAAGRSRESGDAALLLSLWALLTFGLFTMMGTKFHHYILPAVPPLAVRAGLALDRLAFDRVVPAVAPALAPAPAPAASAGAAKSSARAAAAFGGALVVLLLGRDLVAHASDGRLEGPARLMWLFTYRYDRPWPESLDLRTPIAVTCLAAAALHLALASPRLSRFLPAAWATLSIAWAAFGLDVYLPRASMHWGQRAVFDAYYARRAGPEEPIAAYQMNWKGENFYSGNHIAQFGTPTVPPGTPSIGDWIAEQRRDGARVVYLVTEPGRVPGLKRDVGAASVEEVTTREACRQFVLVKATL